MRRDRSKLVDVWLSSVEWDVLRGLNEPPTTRENVATMSRHIERRERVEVG
jgi:hypothetical protein